MTRLVLVLCLASSIAFAQQGAPTNAPATPPAVADSQASREDVLRLFAALRLEAQMNSMMETIQKNVQELIHQSMPSDAYQKMTPQRKKAFDDYLQRTEARVLRVYPVREMLDDFVPLYQKNFSKEDIDAVIAFYASPAGMRLLDKQPTMMQEGMAIVMPKMQSRMKVFMEQTQKEVESMFPDEEGAKPHPQQKKTAPGSLKN